MAGNTVPTGESGTAWPPTALGMAPTRAPMPKPLSRIQFVTVRLPRPPEPAVAASAPIRPQSSGSGRPERRKKPAKVSAQCAAGTKATFTTSRNRNTTPSMIQAKYSSIRSMVPPKERISTTARISAVAIQAWVAWSAAPGMRPIQAPSSVAAALPASAGQPSWKKPSTE